MLLACHLDWLPGLHCVLPVVHPPGSLWDPGCSRGVVWILGVSSAGIGGWLLKVAPSESDFCFQNQLLPLKKPWVSAIPRTPAFSSFFFLFLFFLLLCYFQDILPFVFRNLLEMRRICVVSVLQMSMQLRLLFVDCICQDRLEMEFVQ